MPSGAKLASGWLELTVSTAGAQGAITNAVVPEATKAGTTSGNMFKQMFGAVLSANAVTLIATKAFHAVGALVGSIVSDGMTRAINVENAKAKLVGLGKTGQEAADIMKATALTLQDTMFTLAEGAGVAAQLTLAGIGDVQGSLKSVATAATIANVPLEQMGSYYSTVATQGLRMDTVNSLMIAGIPVLKYLSEQLGVSQADVQKMVSAGQIGFEQFKTAMDANMHEVPPTFASSLTNVHAALARLGEVIMTPALAMGTQLFQAAIPAIDQLKTNIAPLVTQLSSHLQPAVDTVTAAFKRFTHNTGSMGPLRSMFASLKPVIESVGPPVMQIMQAFSPLSLLFKSLQPVLPQLAGVVSQLAASLGGSLGSALTSVASALTPVVTMLTGQLSGVLVTLIPVVSQLATTIGGALSQALTLLAPIVGEVAATLGGALIQVLTAIQPMLPVIIQVIQQVLAAAMQLVPVILSVVQALLPLIPPILSLVSAILPPLLALISSALMPLLQAIGPLVQTIAQVIQTVIAALVPVIQAAVNIISSVIQLLIDLLHGNFSAVWGDVKNIIVAIWEGIKAAVTAAITIVTSVISGALDVIKTAWSAAWGAISGVIATIWNGIKTGVQNGIDAVIGFVSGIQSKVLGALAGAATWLLDVGKNIVQGLVNGIAGAWHFVTDKIASLVNTIAAPIRSLLGIASPSRYFRDEIGQMIPLGLALGIDRTSDQAAAAASRMAAAVQNAVSVTTPTVPLTSATVTAQAAAIGTADMNWVRGEQLLQQLLDLIRTQRLTQRQSTGVGAI